MDTTSAAPTPALPLHTSRAHAAVNAAQPRGLFLGRFAEAHFPRHIRHELALAVVQHAQFIVSIGAPLRGFGSALGLGL